MRAGHMRQQPEYSVNTRKKENPLRDVGGGFARATGFGIGLGL